MNYATLTGITDVTADVIQTNTLVANTIIDTGLSPSRLVYTDNSKKLITRDLANGQIPIGNAGSYSIGNITASNINLAITNEPGSIQLALNDNLTLNTLACGAITCDSFNASTSLSASYFTPLRPLFVDAA